MLWLNLFSLFLSNTIEPTSNICKDNVKIDIKLLLFYTFIFSFNLKMLGYFVCLFTEHITFISAAIDKNVPVFA